MSDESGAVPGQTETARRRFRWWGWVIAGVGVVLAIASGTFLGVTILAVFAVLALTAFQPAIAQWWALIGWALVAWTVLGMLMVGSRPGDVAPLVYLLAAIGLALGITGIIVKSLRR